MILDTLENISTYLELHPNLALGLKYIAETDFFDLEMGKYTIEGEDVFAILQTYTTKPAEQCRYEAHKKYIDIQYMVKGKELMGVTPLNNQTITENLPENDVAFYKAEGQQILVNENCFTIFFPEDVHMPGIQAKNAEEIIKVVVKVAV